MAPSPPKDMPAASPNVDKLDALRDKVREQRDLLISIADAEERVRELKEELNNLQSVDLPELFTAANVDVVGLPAEGNLPAYDAKLAPYYHANIGADWEADRRSAAYSWLDDHAPGLIKTTITVVLDRGDRATAVKVRAGLDKAGIEYDEGLSVPWATLTKFVRETVEEKGTLPPLELLGATVGQVVKLRERKS